MALIVSHIGQDPFENVAPVVRCIIRKISNGHSEHTYKNDGYMITRHMRYINSLSND